VDEIAKWLLQFSGDLLRECIALNKTKMVWYYSASKNGIIPQAKMVLMVLFREQKMVFIVVKSQQQRK
jgi:hypothetical protein